MRFDRLPLLALGLTALYVPAIVTSSARADGWISHVPTVHIAVANTESQAQLADQLRARGYTDVVLSSVPATPANPHPEGNATLTNYPEQTPVRSGWNGVAVKDGQIVQVYADF